MEQENEQQLLGSQLLNDIQSGLTGVGRSIVEASQDDPDTWTDDMIRLGLGGAKNVGNVLNAPGIKQALQALGAPAWVVGKGLGWSLEKAGVDPRYGQIVGEVGEWFIPFYGAGKLVAKARGLNKTVKTLDQFRDATKGTSQLYKQGMGITGEYTSRSDLGRNIINQIKYGPPSSSLDELDLLKNQPFFQYLDPAEQARLIEDFPYLTQDMMRAVDDPLNMGFRTELGRSSIGESTGRRLLDDAEVMRYSEMRQASHDLPNKGRDWLQIYMTDRYSDLNTFGQQRIRRLPELRDEFAELIEAFPELGRQVQIHHIAALKGTMGIFDGLQKGSPLYRDVANQLLKHIPGLGDESSNLLGVIGSSRRAGTPHGLVHAFYREIIGESGELFFTPEVLTRMRYDRTFRLQKADELGRIIKESEIIVRRAQEIISRTQRADVSIYDVIRRISLEEFTESIRLLDKPKTDALIRNALQEEALEWYNKVDPNMLKDQNLDILRDAEKAINSEIFELNERLSNLIDAGQGSSIQADRIRAELRIPKQRQQLISDQIYQIMRN